MWLMLCSLHDEAALWAYRALCRSGVSELELVTSETLICSLRWEHRVTNQRVLTRIELADGRTVDSDAVAGVLNRVSSVPLGHLAFVNHEEQVYALEEFTALFLSWLRGFPCSVLNRPDARSLCGAHRSPPEWQVLAARARMRTNAYTRICSHGFNHSPTTSPTSWNDPSRGHVIVIGQQVVGAPDAATRESCLQLAGLAQTPLLGIDFRVSPTDGWMFEAATPLPDFRLGGSAVIAALRKTLGETLA